MDFRIWEGREREFAICFSTAFLINRFVPQYLTTEFLLIIKIIWGKYFLWFPHVIWNTATSPCYKGPLTFPIVVFSCLNLPLIPGLSPKAPATGNPFVLQCLPFTGPNIKFSSITPCQHWRNLSTEQLKDLCLLIKNYIAVDDRIATVDKTKVSGQTIKQVF